MSRTQEVNRCKHGRIKVWKSRVGCVDCQREHVLTRAEFEIGKLYLLRSGAVIRLTAIDKNPTWPFLVGQAIKTVGGKLISTNKMTWCPDGRYQASPEADTALDIVAEYEEGKPDAGS